MVVGQGRLGQDQGDVPSLEGVAQRRDIIERDDHGLLDSGGRDTPLLGPEPAIRPALDQSLVEMAEVVAVEQEHLVAAGDDPGDPDRLGVRLAG